MCRRSSSHSGAARSELLPLPRTSDRSLLPFSSDPWRLPVYPPPAGWLGTESYTLRTGAWHDRCYDFPFSKLNASQDFQIGYIGMKRNNCLTWNFKLNSTPNMTNVLNWIALVFTHKRMFPPRPKSLLKQIFILFLRFKILLSRLWHKKTLQIHSNLIFNLHHQEEVRTRVFPHPPLPSSPSQALLRNLVFGGEQQGFPCKRSAFKLCVRYSSLASQENSKIFGMFYSKLPF